MPPAGFGRCPHATRHNSPRHNHSLSLRSLHPSIWRQCFFNYDARRPLFKLSRFGFCRWRAITVEAWREGPNIDLVQSKIHQHSVWMLWTHLRVTQVASSSGHESSHKRTIVIFLFSVLGCRYGLFTSNKSKVCSLVGTAKMSIIYSGMLRTVIQ